MMNQLTHNAPVLNYRTQEIARIAQLGTNQDTGKVDKIRTTTNQIWDVADLTPQGPIIDPLDDAALQTCLLIVRECCLGDVQEPQEPQQAAQDLSWLGCLTDHQKGQVWGQLTGGERKELRALKKSTKEGQNRAA